MNAPWWVVLVVGIGAAALPVLIQAWTRRERRGALVSQAGTVVDKALAVLEKSDEHWSERIAQAEAECAEHIKANAQQREDDRRRLDECIEHLRQERELAKELHATIAELWDVRENGF